MFSSRGKGNGNLVYVERRDKFGVFDIFCLVFVKDKKLCFASRKLHMMLLTKKERQIQKHIWSWWRSFDTRAVSSACPTLATMIPEMVVPKPLFWAEMSCSLL